MDGRGVSAEPLSIDRGPAPFLYYKPKPTCARGMCHGAVRRVSRSRFIKDGLVRWGVTKPLKYEASENICAPLSKPL